ncbi:uncharacterized protein LOC116338647 isoform X2 [Contarinia nasturtii]|uniref:uncharacterized protein LOC116338647 isoform X2 n=1 Tax=Contarinia nasturtii TaxID=265458 RepID=UPI0012D40A32|nr:uncharacterized protein LOC116338647 isoform X2 [Contarinia nasturtii]
MYKRENRQWHQTSTSFINRGRRMVELIFYLHSLAVCSLVTVTATVEDNAVSICDINNIDKCQCKRMITNIDAYSPFVPIKNENQTNHILNVSFYVEGNKNWHISFSQNDRVNYRNRPSYEILAEWNSTRIIFTRKRSILSDVLVPPTIPDFANKIFPINIQMTKAGFIYLYCGNSLLMRTFDRKPLSVAYMSFSSVKSSRVKYSTG